MNNKNIILNSSPYSNFLYLQGNKLYAHGSTEQTSY